MSTRSLIRALALLSVPVVATTAFSTTAIAAPKVKPPTPTKPVYVALGDSYAAGVGAGSYLSDRTDCHRSLKGYPGLIASAGGYALNLQACSGADIADVASLQLGALATAKPAKVTITVGGNDVGFADTMSTCLGSDTGACLAAVATAEAVIADTESTTGLPARLGKLFLDVKAKSPATATIVATGYPQLLSTTRPECSLLTSFTLEEVNALNTAASHLDALIKTKADEAGIGYATVEDDFLGHEVCTSSPWINNVRVLTPFESFHPNSTGYASGYKPDVAAALRATTTSTSTMTITTGGQTSSDTKRGTVKATR